MNEFKPEFYKRFIAKDKYSTRQIIVGMLSRYTEEEIKGLFSQGIKQSIVSKLRKLDCFVYIEEIDSFFSPDVSDVEEIINWVHELMPDQDGEALKAYVCYKWREYMNKHISRINNYLKTKNYAIWSNCVCKPYSNEEGMESYYRKYDEVKLEKIPFSMRKVK